MPRLRWASCYCAHGTVCLWVRWSSDPSRLSTSRAVENYRCYRRSLHSAGLCVDLTTAAIESVGAAAEVQYTVGWPYHEEGAGQWAGAEQAERAG